MSMLFEKIFIILQIDLHKSKSGGRNVVFITIFIESGAALIVSF